MRKRKVITLILLGVFLAGLSLLLYPSVSSYWNSITQSRAIVDYDTIVKSLSPKDYTAYFERAEEYNSELKALPFPLMEYQQISGYDDCLNAAGDGIIGYIDIDKIQVKLPIYHGTDPSILNHACGHIQGSSFPIAGKGTHAAISAHRGLPSAKLFSDLDKLEVGDTFRITVLDKTFIYEVDQIKTVLPDDVSTCSSTRRRSSAPWSPARPMASIPIGCWCAATGSNLRICAPLGPYRMRLSSIG